MSVQGPEGMAYWPGCFRSLLGLVDLGLQMTVSVDDGARTHLVLGDGGQCDVDGGQVAVALRNVDGSGNVTALLTGTQGRFTIGRKCQ